MMKFSLGMTSALLLLSGGAALAQTDLVSLGMGKDGLDYFIDPATIQRSRPIASFTLIAPLDPPNRLGVTRYSIFERVNCTERTSISRTKTTYFEKIKPYTSAEDTRERSIESGTPVAKAFEMACTSQ